MNAFVKKIKSSKWGLVESLHLITGLLLIISGGISYLQEGVSMMLSWSIFGAMYVSMSDIGEKCMCCEEKTSLNHYVRIFFAFLGMTLAVWLMVYLAFSF